MFTKLFYFTRHFVDIDKGYSVFACALSYLNPGLGEFGPLSELLPGVDVRVMSPLEGPLQLLQLLCREGGPTTPLLPLKWQIRL